MQDYTLVDADTTGARFAAPPPEKFMTALPFIAASAMLTYFAVSAWFTSPVEDRPWAVLLLALAVAAAGGAWAMWRRPGPPPVLRFDNFSRTIRFEDAAGRLVGSVPYDDVGSLEAGKYSSESGSTSYTTYVIGVTLRDGRYLRLCRDTQSVRDEQLERLRRCLPFG